MHNIVLHVRLRDTSAHTNVAFLNKTFYTHIHAYMQTHIHTPMYIIVVVITWRPSGGQQRIEK